MLVGERDGYSTHRRICKYEPQGDHEEGSTRPWKDFISSGHQGSDVSIWKVIARETDQLYPFPMQLEGASSFEPLICSIAYNYSYKQAA